MEPRPTLGLEVEPGDRTFPEATVVEQAWATGQPGLAGMRGGRPWPWVGAPHTWGFSEKWDLAESTPEGHRHGRAE